MLLFNQLPALFSQTELANTRSKKKKMKKISGCFPWILIQSGEGYFALQGLGGAGNWGEGTILPGDCDVLEVL